MGALKHLKTGSTADFLIVVGPGQSFPLRSHQADAVAQWQDDGELSGMLAVAKGKLFYVNMSGEHEQLVAKTPAKAPSTS